MSRVSANVVATFASRACSALLLLALVPVYIQFLGVEAYGIVGVFVTLQALSSLLDLGFGPATTRQLAQLSGRNEPGEMRDLLRTMEVVYWVTAVGIALVSLVLAPALAKYWLKPDKLSEPELRGALMAAGLALALQWPSNLYSGGLAGLQRQIVLAWIMGLAAVFRALISVASLAFIAPTLEAFFLAQAFSNLVQTVITAACLWRALPRSSSISSFRFRIVRSLLPFAAGMTGISVTTVILTQLDKAVLSRTLPLETFGYYAVASTFATGLYVLISPVFVALFPRFAELISKGRHIDAIGLYDKGSQILSVMILPATAVISFFSFDLLSLWTRNATVATNSHLVLSLLILGNAMNGLMNVPYALQLAHGWTSLSFYSNLVAIVVCAPLTYWLSLKFGAVGGALVWVLLTFTYIVATLPIVHRKLMPRRLKHWYLVNVGGPAIAAFSVVAVARGCVPGPLPLPLSAAIIALVSIASLAAAIVAAPATRAILGRYVLRTSQRAGFGS